MDLFDHIEAPQLPFALPDTAGYDTYWDASRQGFVINVPGGVLFYAEHFFGAKVSDRALEYFQHNDTCDWRTACWPELCQETFERMRFTHINWRREQVRMFGRTHALPRLTAWYGDPGMTYSYSGINMHPEPWNEGLWYFKQQAEQAAATPFNSVLLNWYRDGEDHMGWHADDEAELGTNPVIASVNFGQERDFVLRRNDDRSQKIVMPLRHGTLLVMHGALQHHWQHAVPRRKRVTGSRFNLTFRYVIPG